MRQWVVSNLSFANVTSLAASCVALGGVPYAAAVMVPASSLAQEITAAPGLPSAQQALAATDPPTGLVPGYSGSPAATSPTTTAYEQAVSAAQGFSTASLSVQNAGVNPQVSVYVPPSPKLL